MTRRKLFTAIVCAMFLCALSGCGGREMEAAQTETYTDKDNLKQAGLGGLVMLYDDSVWTYEEAQGTDSSLVFSDKNGSILGVSCSRESYYQHPLDMARTSQQIYSTYPGYEEMEAPAEVTAQGETWYEWTYCYEENGVKTVSLQRLYAKNYYAYTISYVAVQDDFDAGKREALKAMNSIAMNVPDNAEAEEKAKGFLAGEWDLAEAGYLCIHEDGTYEWYMESSKDEKNMHKGTYGCDVESSAAGFGEGEGIYLALFPEALYADGEKGATANAKYDYFINLETQADGSYQMINGSTFNGYSMVRQ